MSEAISTTWMGRIKSEKCGEVTRRVAYPRFEVVSF